MSEQTTASQTSGRNHVGNKLTPLMIAALGVVYGDIGTSPLYTIREVFSPSSGLSTTPEHLIGGVSVIFWALMVVVTLKYVILVLRADNHGEGGSIALTALAADAVQSRPRLRYVLLLLGVFGATLFYGDSVITPAISVLGAMEGLQIIQPELSHYIVPISVVILIGLFAMQRTGTATVGKLFGPVMAIWFITLAVFGILNIAQEPAILAALNPLQALHFISIQGSSLLLSVGAIVLALTGAEALYADMGHFGKHPIRYTWIGMVLPSLAINYMGQGALLIHNPQAIENPFYHQFPESWLVAALLLSTLAAIIASQAVISGAYSITKQAMHLGFLPRMHIQYTSAKEAGQIYIPTVNWALMVTIIFVVLLFQKSSALAAAYGVAVTMTMLITTILTYFVVRHGWHMSNFASIAATMFFLGIDLLLVTSCIIKFFDGGWLPIVLAIVLFTVMSTWWRGRTLLFQAISRDGIELTQFVHSLSAHSAHRVERTAIYPVGNPDIVPQALLHNLKHNQVLHHCNIILTVRFLSMPWVTNEKRAQVEKLGNQFWRITVYFGFMNKPDVPKALRCCNLEGLSIPEFETTYFLSRDTVVPSPGRGMSNLRERLFAAMMRNAGNVVEFFRLPDNAVVEIGTRVQI